MFYFIKSPWWLKRFFPERLWTIDTKGEKIIYLTFDDGPNPIATPFVLNELSKYNAKATFFCIGKNVETNFGLYKNIINDGHAVGNHTFSHLNGWKTDDKVYMEDIDRAKKIIDSTLFRPPYGRISLFQTKLLHQHKLNFKIVMWSVLSGDFDIKLSPKKCLNNVLLSTQSGDIIVFHDSEKAFERLQYVLPKMLAYFSDKGYRFEKIKN